jgi:hypothetical protein
MSRVIKRANTVHDANCLAALTTLQAALIGVTNQSAVNAPYVTFYRTCLASAITNKCDSDTG